jgi:hypothetical protein
MIFRSFAFALSAIALASTAGFSKCPTLLSNDTVRSWGAAVASQRDLDRVYQPPGFRSLGQPVPYVVVQLDSTGAPAVGMFRLGNILWREQGKDAELLMRSFRDAYGATATCSEAGCETPRVPTRQVGALKYSEVGSAYPFEGRWTGPAVGKLMEDGRYGSDHHELMFEFCHYFSNDDARYPPR